MSINATVAQSSELDGNSISAQPSAVSVQGDEQFGVWLQQAERQSQTVECDKSISEVAGLLDLLPAPDKQLPTLDELVRKVGARDYLRRWRLEFGFSQAEVARFIGVSASTFASWEAGRTTPTRDNLLKFREAFGACIHDQLAIESYGRKEAFLSVRTGVVR